MSEIFWCPAEPENFPPECQPYFCRPLTVQLACDLQTHAHNRTCSELAKCAMYVRELLVAD